MSAKQKDVGSSPAHDQKLFCAGFFRLGETFFRKFFKCLPRAPPSVFSILQKNVCSKTPKCPLLHFSALCNLPETKKIQEKNFKKFKIGLFFIFFLTRVL